MARFRRLVWLAAATALFAPGSLSLALWAQSSTSTPADARGGAVRGSVVDGSSGVLPGVAVTATSADGRSLGSTVTSGAGEFVLERLPAGQVTLLFHLDGFVDATVKVNVQPNGAGSESAIVQRLDIAALAETVTVRGDPPPPPPPPPPPAIQPVPQHDETAVCAPAKAEAPVPAFGVLRAGRKDPRQGLYATGDEVVIEGGTETGLAVGQNFVVRRRFGTDLTEGPKLPMFGEHSSGLLQIVSVGERISSAVVVYACDAMEPGDYLATFHPDPARAPEPYGTPDFQRAARILFADAGQTVGLTKRLLVIGQGSTHGVRAGQRFTVFRKAKYGQTIVGHAVVVAVRMISATILVEHATDIIDLGKNGDWAAPHELPQLGRR